MFFVHFYQMVMNQYQHMNMMPGGNITRIQDISNKDIANINPFKYRSYYYDGDINMYYCLSRYYMVQWRRWLNADNPNYLSQEDINNLNLFVYCGNNPVMYVDGSGKFFLIALIDIIAIVAMVAIVIESIHSISKIKANDTIEKVRQNDSLKNEYTKEEAETEISEITGHKAKFNGNDVVITDSYEIKDRETRLLVSTIISRTYYMDGENKVFYTYRSVENLSAEWEVHNFLSNIGFKPDSTNHVNLDYTKDKRISVRVATAIFEYFSWL